MTSGQVRARSSGGPPRPPSRPRRHMRGPLVPRRPQAGSMLHDPPCPCRLGRQIAISHMPLFKQHTPAAPALRALRGPALPVRIPARPGPARPDPTRPGPAHIARFPQSVSPDGPAPHRAGGTGGTGPGPGHGPQARLGPVRVLRAGCLPVQARSLRCRAVPELAKPPSSRRPSHADCLRSQHARAPCRRRACDGLTRAGGHWPGAAFRRYGPGRAGGHGSRR